jgi:phage terminase large subunit GpA-like protein
VPCPHCGEAQTLKWPQVRWTDGSADAAYHCEACDKRWSDTQRWAAVRRGDWRADKPFNGTAGFHLSELYSPWRRLAETVQDFLDAKGKPEPVGLGARL